MQTIHHRNDEECDKLLLKQGEKATYQDLSGLVVVEELQRIG
jgi:hypothetical protein